MVMQIAVIGKEECTGEEYEAARKAGALIAGKGAILCCGGRGGVMEAACRGAREAGGMTVGILPDTGSGNPPQRGPIPPGRSRLPSGPGNPYLDVAIRTGMGYGRNVILVHTGDAVVAIGGGYGTLSEIAIALKARKEVFGYRTWDIAGVVPCSTPEEAITRAVAAAGRSG
ncbi:MAG TPA: LOG family protein [Methanomicrobiales archaeon]|jgi:predicted Rossmann-fold nucleotide-binding protein|nr:LOG family protein [Methanomicrobiales archaeon]